MPENKRASKKANVPLDVFSDAIDKKREELVSVIVAELRRKFMSVNPYRFLVKPDPFFDDFQTELTETAIVQYVEKIFKELKPVSAINSCIEMTAIIVDRISSYPEVRLFLNSGSNRKKLRRQASHAIRNLPVVESIAEEVMQAVTPSDVFAWLGAKTKHSQLFARAKEQYEARQRLSDDFVRSMPDNYADFFPAARSIRRRFVIHVGPTNSGKTHDAIEALKAAPRGIYLAPLRLLAYEQYENMVNSGVPCSMITGEERIIDLAATHQASTIEMLDIEKTWDVAVIDEAQMCADSQRGGGWSTAIYGVKAYEVHLCTAPEATDLLVKMVKDCGDEYEIVEHKRFVPLEVDYSSIIFPQSIQPGDALIVFSRKDVHAVAGELLQKRGIKSSTIYGALPYDVRHREAERFANGETKVVVATDAIGMGMNLPIRRIVFLQSVKYDGKSFRPLLKSELKQIAGRAGRYGKYELGQVNIIGNKKPLVRALSEDVPPIAKASINIPDSFLRRDGNVSDIMSVWSSIPALDKLFKTDVSEKIELVKKMEQIKNDKELILRFLRFSIDTKDTSLVNTYLSFFAATDGDQHAPVYQTVSACRPDAVADDAHGLSELERMYRLLDFLYAYAVAFGENSAEVIATEKKREISKRIMRILANGNYSRRNCRICGKPLAWDHPYGLCDSCYENSYGYHDDSDWFGW